MGHPRDYPNIDEFLGQSSKKSNAIEQTLSTESESVLRKLDSAFSYLDDDAKTKDWRNQLANGDLDEVYAEIDLFRWFCERMEGGENIELNAEYDETGSDFDIRIEKNSHKYWIDVRTPEGFSSEVGDRFQHLPGDATAKSIENKFESQFKPARKKLDESLLVLAICKKVPLADDIFFTEYLQELERGERDYPGSYCDAIIDYNSISRDVDPNVTPLSEKGIHVSRLIETLRA